MASAEAGCRDGTGFLEQRHSIRGPTDRQRRCEDGVRLRVGDNLARLRLCATRLMNGDEAEANGERSQAPSELGHGSHGNAVPSLQGDEDGRLWLMVHSGSRGIGPAVRDHHMGRAEDVGADSAL